MGDLPPRLIGLLCVAIFTAIVARRVRLPYTVGLVAMGLGRAFLPLPDIGLTRDLIFQFILPPLLFEAALQIHWRELRRDMPVVLTLATLGVIGTAAIVAAGTIVVLGWAAPQAVVFGVLIAATDPVSVIALFKDLGLHGRLRLLVETESLLNDGVAAVLFTLAYAWAGSGGTLPPAGDIAWTVLREAGGGLATGIATGAVCILVAGRTADHLVETALTLVAAYGAFYAASALHASGVLATVAAGLMLGNFGVLTQEGAISDLGRRFVLGFWDFAAFLMNSLVFLLFGLAVARTPLGQLGAVPLLVVIALVLLGRALTVYPLCALFRGTLRVKLAEQHVLFWGGLRGALALALALSLPEGFAGRDAILLATYACVVFSVVVQGLTMAPLIKLASGGRDSAPGQAGA